RADRLVENIEICRRLWSEERVSYKGRFRSFEDVTLQPRPVQQPCPIWIASNPRPPLAGPRLERALQRVAQRADGWMTTRLAPGLARNNWSGIARALEREGRDPDAFPTMAYHNVNLNPDRQAALEETQTLPGCVLRPGVLSADGRGVDGGGHDRAVPRPPARAARGGAEVRHAAHHVVASNRAVRAPGRRAPAPPVDRRVTRRLAP